MVKLTERKAKKSKVKEDRLVYVAHSQGHLIDIHVGGRRVLQVTFFKGRQATLSIAQDALRRLQAGWSVEDVKKERDMQYHRSKSVPLTHEWEPWVRKEAERKTKGKAWRGEVSPLFSRICSFA